MRKSTALAAVLLALGFYPTAGRAADIPIAVAEAPAPPTTQTSPGRTSRRSANGSANGGANPGRVVSAQLEGGAFEVGQARLKDIADVQGVRRNQLIGYGLIVGLEGTGDGQSAQFTQSSIVNMLRRFGVNVSIDQVRVKNVAAVMVTADLPPSAKRGSRIDVTVSSIGDAKSLQGGLLLQTPMLAADGKIYAVAQGAISIGGFNFESGGSKVQKNHVNVGMIPHGANIESEAPVTLTDGNTIQITLREPDFTTANRAAAAIRRQMPGVDALALDQATIGVSIPANRAGDIVNFLSQVETVRVTPDMQAKIVVNERTGTVVMGGNVRLAPGSIAHGAISIRVVNTPLVVPAPPNSINAPPPVVVPLQDVQVNERRAQFAPIGATTTITQLVSALNSLGVTPRDLITILQAMHGAGMIAAEIEVQ